MSFNDESYRKMLACFRTDDLRNLLATFGYAAGVRTPLLKNKALDLLRCRPESFDIQAYLSKISEIYCNMEIDMRYPNTMDFDEESYREMLDCFQTTDLRNLLATFGYAAGDQTSLLKDKALDLLRRRPESFDIQAYLSEITEIYFKIQIMKEIPNTMDFDDVLYRRMLSTFRTQDLQRLLAPYGYATEVRKSVLEDKALDLLRSRSVTFDMHSYLTNISVIFCNRPYEPKSRSLTRNTMQQANTIMTIPQRYDTPPPQYSQSTIRIVRPGLPQIPRGENAYNNYPHGYQPNDPDWIEGVPINNPLNRIPRDQRRFELGLHVWNRNNAITIQQSPPPAVKEIPIESITLDGIDEEISDVKYELKSDPKPENSKEPENLKISLNDLTLSDDDEEAPRGKE